MDDYLTLASQNSIVDLRRQKFGLMAQEETFPREAAPVRKVVQISTMVHEEKDWAFIALANLSERTLRRVNHTVIQLFIEQPSEGVINASRLSRIYLDHLLV